MKKFKIDRLEIFHLKLRLQHAFETSFSRSNFHHTLITKASSGGTAGFGECPASSAPYYSYETVYTARYVMKEFLAPLLRDAYLDSPQQVPQLFAKVRGHNMAKSSIEQATWDLYARMNNKPLCKIYAGRRAFRERIPAGISLGIERNVRALLKQIEFALLKKYHRIKIKIKPGWDIRVIKQVRKAFSDIKLMVDANGAYTLNDARLLKSLDEFNLMMIEQPLSYDDFIDHSRLQKMIKTPLCLDESIKSLSDAKTAIELGSCRIINIKQARVGGPSNAITLHDLCKKRGVPVWCGGLLETGIGRAHNIALASLENFRLPGDISESARYYKVDITDPAITLHHDGYIQVSTKPGLGYDVIKGLLRRYTIASERLI